MTLVPRKGFKKDVGDAELRGLDGRELKKDVGDAELRGLDGRELKKDVGDAELRGLDAGELKKRDFNERDGEGGLAEDR